MEQAPDYILRIGTRVLTNETLGPTTGMMVPGRHIAQRRPACRGTINGVVGGHGGDVYWVLHEHSTAVAPYCWSEFEVVS